MSTSTVQKRSSIFTKRLSAWLKRNWQDLLFSLVLFALTGFIAFKNFTPNTFLTGWDNLHPEFNFKSNIIRSLNTAWQEYQGVGLLGGMAHAADLPRQLFLWLVSIFLPVSLIRYFWTFLMLFLGPLGVYFCLKDKTKFGGLAASIFYIFNLAAVQYFFVPFETFIGFYGFLPWLVCFVLKYLKSGKKEDLLSYFIVSIFATGGFYVQTLFLVYAVFLAVILFGSIVRKFRTNLSRSILILLVTLIVNGFWLFPVSWFSLTSSSVPINSEINRIATPETLYMNQARTSFEDVANLRGYWFDYYDFGKDGEFNYLFQDWIDWTNKPYVSEIGIVLFLASATGLLLSAQFEWLILLGISFVMLSGFTIPNSILSEAFRNAFTKWSVALSFVISMGLGFLASKFKKASILPALIVIALSIYSVFPILKGKLVSERVRTNIPGEYFQTFKWFNESTKGERVSFLPAFDRWGWNYHDWGYGGSGFIWYGIKNPIIDRAFNVWSPYNEGYYEEITKAILDGDREAFVGTLNKYQVRYLLIDNSVIFPWGDKELLKLGTVEEFMKDLGYKSTFNSGFISVYDTGINTNNFVSAPQKYTFVDANLTYSSFDPVYKKYGNYVQDENATSYPFINFDQRGPIEIRENDNQLEFINEEKNAKVIIEETEKLTETFEKDHGYPDSHNCDLKENGIVKTTQLSQGREYLARGGGVSCDYFVFDNVASDSAYVVHIKGENKTGRSLKIYLFDWISKRTRLEKLLSEKSFNEYFVVYPGSEGYTLNVETRSFGKMESENIIEKIELIPFDIDFISSLYNGRENSEGFINNLAIKNVIKYGTGIYKVDVEGYGLLQLGQGYEDGWIAFDKSNLRLDKKLKHLQINTWSNGWEVPNGVSTVYIIFWLQFLEWFGFVLLFLTGAILMLKLASVNKSSR